MRLLKISLCILVFSLVFIGQTNRGGISGTVTDSNGAVVPGVKVTVTSIGTNQSTTVTTSSSGAFQIPSLEPTQYKILAEAKNFKRALIENIKVDTATILSLNIILEIGDFSESVTVQADDTLINTESGTTTRTISEMQLRELPLNNRSVLDLAVTVANVSGDAGSEDAEVTSGQPSPGYNLSLNGGRPGGTSILADGVNNTGVGIGRSMVSFTPETVQEFTVLTSAYSAEYGNTSGGVINATTKSGTNRFNGTALLYHRNPKTNSQPYRIGTTPRTPNNLRYTQGSLTVGGPVYLPRFGEGVPPLYDGHDRTFFFFAYEPRWRKDFITATTLLPTAAMRTGDFRGLTRTSSGWVPSAVAAQFGAATTGPSALYQQYTIINGRYVPIVRQPIPGTTPVQTYQYCQFNDPRATMVLVAGVMTPQCPALVNSTPNDALNVIPSQFIDPTALRVLSFMPMGGDYFLDGGLIRNHIVTRQVTQNEARYTMKFDHQITRKNKASFRYTVTPAIAVRDFGTDVNGSTGVFSDAKQFLLTDDHVFSPTIVNNLRLGYTKGVYSEDFAPQFSINGGRNLATELGLQSLTNGGLPLFRVSGDTAGNAFTDIGSSGSTNNFNKEERYSIDDIVYWNRGNMGWKFGVNMSLAKLNVVPFFGASGGSWEFRVVNTSAARGTGTAEGGHPIASLLLGVPNSILVKPLLADYNYFYKSGAAFVQNDWKVRPNLTVNLGLRYSLQTPRGERNNQQGVFDQSLSQTVSLTAAQRLATAIGLGVLPAGSPAGTAIPAPYDSIIPNSATIPVFALAGRNGRSRYLIPIDYTGLEPRFGFAWSPKFSKFLEKRSAVIRGGYGISHAPLTGNNRSPNPDPFSTVTISSILTTGASPTAACPSLPVPCASTGTADPNQPIRLTGNVPVITPGGYEATLRSAYGLTSDGLIGLNSIGLPSGFATASDGSGKVPYIQNWNVSFSFEVMRNTMVEVAYTGNKGTHLYMPNVNINPKDFALTELLEGANLNAEQAFSDPLGRRNALGAVVTIPRNSINSAFFGFGNLNRYYDPSASSIYHGAYVEMRRRFSGGFSFTTNYTFGKSIDDASDSSPDVRVLTSGTTLGQVYYGAPRSGDRAVSAFDLRHNFNTTFVAELPFGRGKTFFGGTSGLVNAIIGGWSTSGVLRYQGGQPYTPFLTDTNRLGGVNRSVRMNIVEGVPLKNPRYSEGCSVGGGCEPWVNPAAFMRPAKGELGSSPRTINLRSPIQQYFDLTVQKNFSLGSEGRRKLNFRVDLLNALNHPVYRYNNTGNTPFGFGTSPTETVPSAAEITAYNNFAPGRAVTAAQLTTLLNSARLPSGALPLDFFSVRIPEGFATNNLNNYDITTLEGLKLYKLRQTYDPNFGSLFSPAGNARYIQFGVRLFF